MDEERRIPAEGDLHSVVVIDSHVFELRYGYCDERDRITGEPYILYPDLLTDPRFTADGRRIVAALQSICPHYVCPPEGCPEDCCYTCRFYSDPRAEIGICGCPQTTQPQQGGNVHEKQND